MIDSPWRNHGQGNNLRFNHLQQTNFSLQNVQADSLKNISIVPAQQASVPHHSIQPEGILWYGQLGVDEADVQNQAFAENS